MKKSDAAHLIFNDEKKCVVIAEVGVNHDGNVEKAKELALTAIDCGADIVKFQIFDANEEISESAKMTDYQRINTKSDDSQLQMASDLELTLADQRSLAKFCSEHKIPYMYSVFDDKSLEFALNDLGADLIKVPSGDITNYPLLEKIAQSGVDLIISTGCCYLNEIDQAIEFLRVKMAFPENQKLMIFQCVSEYPAPANETNLSMLSHFSNRYGIPVGLSDHSDGVFVPILAAAAGARAIEKHFTYDKLAEGPDHLASCDPTELKELCNQIKKVIGVLGNNTKKPTKSEAKNRILIRKSVVARHKLSAGDKLTIDDLAFKRPGTGVSPTEFQYFINKKLKVFKSKDDLIEKEDVS